MVRLGRINAAGLDTNRNGCRRMNVSTAKRSRVNKASRIIWAILYCGKQTLPRSGRHGVFLVIFGSAAFTANLSNHEALSSTGQL